MNGDEVTLVGRKILLVEDEPLITLDVESILFSLGCVVAGSAGSLARALQLAETTEIDAALLDVVLEDGHVFPVIDILVARGIPVVLLSSGMQDDLPAAYRHLSLVGKPIATAELKCGLERALF